MTFVQDVESTGMKVLKWLGRHLTAVIFAAIGIGIAYYAIDSIATGESQKDELYKQRSKGEKLAVNDARISLEKVFPADKITYEMYSDAENNALHNYQQSADYARITDKIKETDRSNRIFGFLTNIGYFLIGVSLAPVLTGLTLYLMTKVNFTRIMMKGDNDKFEASESMAAMGLAGTIYKSIIWSWTAFGLVYVIANAFVS
jgi:hypothetical protein